MNALVAKWGGDVIAELAVALVFYVTERGYVCPMVEGRLSRMA